MREASGRVFCLFAGKAVRFSAQLVKRVVFAGEGNHNAREPQYADEVRNHHEAVEQVGELPHKIHLHHRAEQHEEDDDHGVHRHSLFPEQVFHVRLTEEIPADDGGEGEEEHADGDENIAELAHHRVERGLCERGGRERRAGSVRHCERAGRDDDESCHREDDERVDKHAHKGHDALVAGVLDLCQRMRVRRGTHARLVGKEAARHAETDGLAHRDARHAAGHSLRVKGQHEDLRESVAEVAEIRKDDDERTQNIQHRHHRHDLFRHGGDALLAAEENHGRNRRHHDAHGDAGHAECILERVADGVALHHVAHEAQRQRDGHGKEAREELAEPALEPRLDVVHRPAGHFAVHGCLVFLREGGLRIDGGHAEKGGQPHPEDGPRPAGGDGRGCARNVACAHLSRHGGGQRLEGTHAVRAGLVAAQADVPEYGLQALLEFAHLHGLQADGEPDPRAAQQNQQDRVPKGRVDAFHNGGQAAGNRRKIHDACSPSCLPAETGAVRFIIAKQERCCNFYLPFLHNFFPSAKERPLLHGKIGEKAKIPPFPGRRNGGRNM